MRFSCAFVVAASLLGTWNVPVAAQSPDPLSASSSPTAVAADAALLNRLGNLPLRFEVNRGQTDPRVKFVSPNGARTLFLTSTGAVLKLNAAAADGATSQPVLSLDWLAANPRVNLTGVDELPGRSNFLIGRDRERW